MEWIMQLSPWKKLRMFLQKEDAQISIGEHVYIPHLPEFQKCEEEEQVNCEMY